MEFDIFEASAHESPRKQNRAKLVAIIDGAFSRVLEKHVAEQKGISPYHITIKGVTFDFYDLVNALPVRPGPAAEHALKKLMYAGARGHKDREKDLRETIWSVERQLELDAQESIPSKEWIAAVSFCDEDVTPAAGASEEAPLRKTVNGVELELVPKEELRVWDAPFGSAEECVAQIHIWSDHEWVPLDQADLRFERQEWCWFLSHENAKNAIEANKFWRFVDRPTVIWNGKGLDG